MPKCWRQLHLRLNAEETAETYRYLSVVWLGTKPTTPSFRNETGTESVMDNIVGWVAITQSMGWLLRGLGHLAMAGVPLFAPACAL